MTGPGSGVSASLGIAAETAYGTFEAPTRWTEFESETMEWKPTRTVGAGLYAGGQVSRSSQRATTTATANGDIVTPVYTKGMGLWLAMIFGTLGITPTEVGVTGAYVQAHALGSTQGQSCSVQLGRPTMDGVVHPYTYIGTKATKAVFEAKVDEPLRLTISLDSKDVTEADGLTTAVYQSANPAFFWNEGEFLMGELGAEELVEGVRAFTLTLERPSKVDNYYLDGTGRKQSPVQDGFFKISGEIDTDFLSKAAFADLFVADTPQSIIVPFTGPLIGGASTFGFQLAVPHANFDSGPPMVSGPDILQPKMTFEGLFDDSTVPVTCTYTSTDTVL